MKKEKLNLENAYANDGMCGLCTLCWFQPETGAMVAMFLGMPPME
jgi:hypothetical protein